MNRQQMHEAMQIARNYAKVNLLAKKLGSLYYEIITEGGYFLTNEEANILRSADAVIDRLRNATNEWEASQYAAKTLTENPSLT